MTVFGGVILQDTFELAAAQGGDGRCFFRERVSFAAVGVCELPQTGDRLEMRGIVRGVGSLKTHLLFLLLDASLQAFHENKTPFLVQGVAPLPRLMRPPFRS